MPPKKPGSFDLEDPPIPAESKVQEEAPSGEQYFLLSLIEPRLLSLWGTQFVEMGLSEVNCLISEVGGIEGERCYLCVSFLPGLFFTSS